ncbi:HAD family hydrolase [Vibrio superstes]|uniref:Haloacid dehalogenase n=1 Tax=Vibrio superstes NBRC 103154 TaxID=1219062 RepID=A0A511QW56_9VIBR|nr:HAD family hydrolase [Vibrio superstes]GEM81613.1 haloacid dehalogenase [Vibrio superstes NBRC 103154]
MTQSIHVFDLDETLIAGDSAVLWHEYLVEKGVISDPDFLQEDARQMELYAAGTQDMGDYLDFAMLPLLEVPKIKLESLASHFVTERILPIFYPEAKSLLEEIDQTGEPRVLISATVDYLVQVVATALGFKTAFGIELEQENGFFKGNMIGIPTFREGKVKKFEHWLTQNPELTQHKVEFYSDSINDKPMCVRADSAFAVNPCAQLEIEANSNGWKILSWRL